MLLSEINEYLMWHQVRVVNIEDNPTLKDAVKSLDEELISDLCKINNHNYVKRINKFVIYNSPEQLLPNDVVDYWYHNHNVNFEVSMLVESSIFCGDVNLSHREIKILPNNLVFNNLFCYGTLLNELPNGLIVNNELDIRNTSKLKIPDDAIINGRLLQNNSPCRRDIFS